MNRSIIFFFAILAVSQAYNATYNATYYTAKDAIDHQYIVVLWPQYDVNAVTKVLEVDTSGIFSGAIIKWKFAKVLNGFSVKLSKAALAKVRAMEQVKYVTQDSVVRTQAVASWGLDRIDQRYLPLDGEDPTFTGDGTGINVYIIDTGIYPESMYFEDRAYIAFDANPDRKNYGIDCNGHGTHCAGTVGSNPYGVARGVKLYGVRVLSCLGFGSTSDVVAGCDFVAKEAQRPAVASMSLGGSANTAMDDAVQAMINAGVTVAVAAGNSADDACGSSPARVSDAITVGATADDDTRASFSSYGSCLDIFAPGVDIPSAYIGGPERTESLSGTSMACPHVAGAAAIALGNSPQMVPVEVKSKVLYDSTKDVVIDAGDLSPNRLLFVP